MRKENKITIRFYEPKDFEAVISLLKDAEMDVNYHPHAFGSKALVAENDKNVVGFIWAIAGNSPVIYLQDFVIAKKCQYKSASKHPGIPLLANLMGLLKKLGYTNYVTNIQPERRKVLSMAKKLGGNDYGRQHLIGGSIETFLSKISTI